MNEVSITLRFRSKQAKDYFMGQLSDGWGENHVDLAWEGDFDAAASYQVTVWDLEGREVEESTP